MRTTATSRLQQHRQQGRRRLLILSLAESLAEDGDNSDDSDEQLLSRRTFWTRSTSSATTAAALLLATATATSSSSASAEDLTVVKTASGLKYIDLQPGAGPSPSYGNLCSISYKAYIKLPDSGRDKNSNSNNKPQLYDQSDAYLIKHGNGRTIAGLDEGLHTMRVGGLRRLLIPPKLGFVDTGLGPLPDAPWNRSKLNNLLDRMVAMAGGTVIYEVRLRSVIEDEADQGYYTDNSLTPEEFATLRENLRVKGSEEQLRRQAAENSLGVTGQERLL